MIKEGGEERRKGSLRGKGRERKGRQMHKREGKGRGRGREGRKGKGKGESCAMIWNGEVFLFTSHGNNK